MLSEIGELGQFLTLVLSFRFLFGFLVQVLRQLTADITEVRHSHTSFLEPSLGLLQLIIGEL